MRIGVYVGSFNPVHKGHKNIIDCLLNNDYVDKVIVIPTGNYWDKSDLIDIKHRINMLKFYESNKVLINETLNHLKYTYEILRKLSNKKDELYLIIGSDNLPKLNLWKNIDEILNNKIIVLQRDNYDMKDYIVNFKNKENFILISNYKKMDISSTYIRSLICKKNIVLLNELLDEKILEYIIDNNLYIK